MSRLLDSPEWRSLTLRQKNVMNAISGHGEPYKFRAKDLRAVEHLESLGLVTVDWDAFTATEVSREAL